MDVMPTRSSTKTSSPKKATPKKVVKLVAAAKVAPTPVKKVAKKATKKVTPRKVKAAATALKKTAAKSSSKAKESTHTIVVKRQPLGHLLFERKLREAGFRGTVTTDKKILDRYSTDESIFSIRPQVVIQPRHQADVEAAVKMIATETKRFESLSLTPRAAGTGLGGGSLTDSIVLDVSRFMTHIGDFDAKYHTITVEPGAMWRNVEKVLRKHDRYLPPYPASKDICTIGGAVANNSAGPDSLRYGHVASWVSAMNVTLFDGVTYTIKPLTYAELKTLLKKDNAHAAIAREVFTILETHEKEIQKSRPHTTKNSAGYAVWDILSVPVAQFKKNKGYFDLTRLFSGSQGTIGIITSITLKTEPIQHDTELIVVPVFDLMDASKVIEKALDFDPINIELFDALTYDLALKNPQFFKNRLGMLEYYQVMFSMYTTYHVRYARKIPEFTILITLSKKDSRVGVARAVHDLKNHHGKRARHITNATEAEMYWQVRRASYSLSKLQDPKKRPAAFLEDMVVPPENLSKFFAAIKKLLQKYNVHAAVHGHGGNGHLHFYPLLDFTNKTTPQLVLKMSEEFFETAVRYDGNICGEHNDGIIRTPHLDKLFSKHILAWFAQIEHVADPDDIFNPGKKVNPKYDIKESIRHTN